MGYMQLHHSKESMNLMTMCYCWSLTVTITEFMVRYAQPVLGKKENKCLLYDINTIEE